MRKNIFEGNELIMVERDLVEMKQFLRNLISSKPIDDKLGLDDGQLEFMLSATADDYFKFKELYKKILQYLNKIQ